MWLSQHLEKATKQLFSRKGDLFFRILSEWNLIVGKDLRNKARPVDINISKNPALQSVMFLECYNPSFGMEVQMMGPIIVDRLTLYFGYKVIGAIKVRCAAG